MDDSSHTVAPGQTLRRIADDLRRVLSDDRLASDARAVLTACLISIERILADNASSTGMDHTILIVDDQDSTLYIMKNLLVDAGFTVLEATTGAQAIALASTHRIAAVLMDLHLTETTGANLANELRQALDGSTRLPIVGITSDPGAAIRESAHAAGIEVVLQKPLDQGTLVLALKKAIRQRRAPVQSNDELDPAVLEELREVGGDALYAGFVRRALSNARDRLADLQRVRDSADVHAWIEVLHALHGVVLTLGGVRFSETIKPVFSIPPAELPDQMSRWQDVFAVRLAALAAALPE
jgi:CheY-like chemotaxis protein